MTVVSAFSVDVKHLYYYDPSGPREINYDFSDGTAGTGSPIPVNNILLPAGAILQKNENDVAFIFGNIPDMGVSTVTLNPTSQIATVQPSADRGGALLQGTGTPPLPADSWTYALKLQNFSGITDSAKEYRFEIGAAAPGAAGPQPRFRGVWNAAGRLELSAAIFDDEGEGTTLWSGTPTVFTGLTPSATTLELRIVNSGTTVTFSYKKDGAGEWTNLPEAYTIAGGLVFNSLPTRFPYLYLEEKAPESSFNVRSHHWQDQSYAGGSYNAWLTVDDPGQNTYSAVSVNSTDYLNETSLIFNSAGNYWELPAAVFFDNFDNNTVDSSNWTPSGNSVAESDGMLKVDQAVQDNGGKVLSRAFQINPYAPIVVQRKAKVHYNNNYFDGVFALYFGNDVNFASDNSTQSVFVSHANYDYTGANTVPALGFYLGRYAAHFDYSKAMTDPIWDTWFDEKIIYDPVSGVAELYINGIQKATINVGVLPAGATYLRVYLDSWGWDTGHYNYSDDLSVSQKYTGTPVPLSNDAPPASTVTFNFTATKKADNTLVMVSQPITGYVQEFATILSPMGTVTNPTPTFSWTGIANATSYSVQVSDTNWTRVWSKEGLPSTTTSVVYNDDGEGPALEDGRTYYFNIVSTVRTDGMDNDSFAQGSFTYNGTPTLSFNGSVMTSPGWPSINGMQPVQGATVTAIPVPDGMTYGFTTTVANGNFSLTGIPAAPSAFRLVVSPPSVATTYATVLSKHMSWNADINALLPFVLFTQAQYDAFGNGTGNGMIIGRVALKSTPTTFLPGATITAREFIPPATLGATYTVTYTGGGSSAASDGIYMVKGVPDGKLVKLTATLAGYTFEFNDAIVSVQSGCVSEESFFGAPPPTISFSGYVMDSAATPAPVAGALIETRGVPLRMATSNANGYYMLTGLPAGTPFHLKLSKDGYTPTYTADMSSTGNMVNTVEQAFNLFPANQLTTWSVDSSKGIIRARVRDQAGNPIGGVVVSATSQYGQTYTVCYENNCSATSTLASGDDAGRYVIKNVLPGDLVTVRATKTGWTFGNRTYHIYAGGIHQGGITGTALGADEQAIQNGFATAVAAINAGNAAGFLSFVSNDYLKDGETKTNFQNNVLGLIAAGGQMAYVIRSISIQGDTATVEVTWTITMGGQQEVDPETLLFRNENGTWRIYGNQRQHDVKVTSQHWPDGYHAAFTLEDATQQVTSVTVTGPGITGSLSLTFHQQTSDGQLVNVWWNETQPPLIGTSIPVTAPTYTITVAEPSGNTVYNLPVTGWVQEFPTGLFPSGQAGGPVVFTWTGVPGGAEYAVELNDDSYNPVWSQYDIPPTQHWALYASNDEWQAQPLAPGSSYRYWISARDAGENASFAEGQFTYSGTTGISFSGQVTAAANGTALQGVAVTLANNPNTTPATTSNADGTFTLSGVPLGSSFTVKMAMTNYRPTYTAIQNSTTDITAGAPCGLYTTTETASWPVNFTTRGGIAGRVVDSAGANVAGVVVTAQSALHPGVPYAVTYRNDAGAFGGGTTYGNGRFFVLGVNDGDIVTVTAMKRGYSFPQRKFHTFAGGISQGRIAGTVGANSGDMNHDGLLNLTDAVLALQATAGMTPAPIYLDADVNGDNRIDQAELLYILQSVAGSR
ncbi:MAG: carboxypeptidase regulatory-like domain-containing protein [Deltaproteobacteria bacterium]|nr:carboxypeptidase regulatory-like domain-containing protein [Deltaproteobacteria bacterium]